MSYQIRIVLVLMLLSWSVSGSAHHSSNPHFDKTKEVNITGTVTELKMVNPHSYLYLNVEQDGDQVAWRCEMSSATQLKRYGWDSGILSAGDTVTVIGSPARREDNVCFLETITLANGQNASRNDDLSKADVAAKEVVQTPIERAAKLANGDPNLEGDWVTLSFGRNNPKKTAPKYEATDAGKTAAEGYEMAFDDPILNCHIVNIFDAWNHDRNVNNITQTDDVVTITYGFMDFVRTVNLNQDTHPDQITPSAGGHSIGRWDGDVLVVDTIGFEEGLLSHQSGLKHSDQMRVEERFRVNPETNELEREYTVTDPLYLVGVANGKDYMGMSDTPYTSYDCVELSGKNNVRPTDARYNQVDKSGLLVAANAADTVAAAAAPVVASNLPDGSVTPVEESSSLAKWWWLPILAIVFFTVLRLMRRPSGDSND